MPLVSITVSSLEEPSLFNNILYHFKCYMNLEMIMRC